MSLATKLKLPDLYLEEYQHYQSIVLNPNRTTTGDATYTNPRTLASYTTVGTIYQNQGQAGLALLLYNVSPQLKDYIFDDETYELIDDTITQLDWQTATVDTREIRVTKPSTLKTVKFQLTSDIVTGTVIKISTDGGTSSLPLKNEAEEDVLELEKGFYEVIADATFFTLRSKGGLKEFFGDGSDGVLNTTGNLQLTVDVEDVTTVVKQYESITINTGHVLSVDKRCRGLYLYCKGDVIIDGEINMDSRSAAIADTVDQEIIVKDIEALYQRSGLNLIRVPIGGAGGDGGANGGSFGFGGKGSVGYFFGGGRAGGGGGGSSTSTQIGGNGGDSIVSATVGAAGGAGGIGTSGTDGTFGSGGGGAATSGGTGGNGGSSLTGAGGGGGGAATTGNTGGNGQDGVGFGGGTLIIIAKGNISINGTGIISSNGANGANGGDRSGGGFGGGGGGGNGGGVVVLLHKGTYTNIGTIRVDAGIGGAGGSFNGQPGIAGSIGTVQIVQL